MIVRELKERLSQYPDHLEVFMAELTTEFAYGLVNGVRTRELNFMEDPDSKVLARAQVVVISEEE